MPSHTFTSVDQYIGTFPAHVKPMLESVRKAIHQAAPEATETISYNIPAFKLHGVYLVYFAGWQHHISLYPLPKGDAAFRKDILGYKQAKGTLQFPLTKPMPLDLIKKVVGFLAKERH